MIARANFTEMPEEDLDEDDAVDDEMGGETRTRVDVDAAPNLLKFKWTDSGNAERLIAYAGTDLRYVPQWDKWLHWSDGKWDLDARGGCVQRAAKAMGREFQRQAVGDAEALKYGAKLESKKNRDAIVALSKHENSVITDHEAFDADPMLLNVKNGTVNLRTGELGPHRREDLITKIAPVIYDEHGECPRFDRFLSEVMGSDAELVAFVIAFLGYCLTGETREHVLSFWHGKGGNGKSVLAELLLRIMGSYAGKAAPDLLFRTERTDRHPAEIADLHGLRLVFCNETARGRAWDEARVKDMTGGDRIKARRMREDFWEFDPTHKIIVFGNHKPTLRVIDEGMKRRLRLVPFAVSFVGRENRNLLSDLMTEAPGILRRLVGGCVAWHAHGLPSADAIKQSTESYIADEDTLGQFFSEACTLHPDARTTRKRLRDAYVKWTEAGGEEKPIGAKAFAQAVRDLDGVTERQVREGDKAPTHGWAGIGVRDAKL
jgi:putative DNA primase/helicase